MGTKDGVGGGDGMQGQVKSFPVTIGRARRLELIADKNHFIELCLCSE